MSLLRLHRILKEHRGPLRADFRREYGIDLDAALLPGRAGYIRPAVMLDLIDGLSPQAAYWRAVDPARVAWGVPEQLLAQVIDDIRLIAWGMGGKRGRKPQPIPRPGRKDEAGETETIAASNGFVSISDFEAWRQAQLS